MSEPLINSQTPATATILAVPLGLSKGRVPRDRSQIPTGSMPFSKSFSMPIIPRAEWPDRIADMERTKSRLSDICTQAGIPPLNQNGTNYCWAHGPVTAMEIMRAVNGLPYVNLSAASVAAPIKRGANQGGWGGEALEYMVEHGTVSAEFWPLNSRNTSLDSKPEVQANRALHKVTEWLDLDNRDFDQLMTCLLLRIPVAIGLNWWSHEVCAVDPVYEGGKFQVRIRNSWGSWGDNGYGLLSESKATPDDACAPIVSFASLT